MILLFIVALVLYVILIIKSRTTYKDEYNPEWMENLLIWATVILALALFFQIITPKINSYYDTVDFNLQITYIDRLKELIHFIGGLKMIFIIYFCCVLVSLVITYLITFLGDSFDDERKMVLVIGVLHFIVLIVIIIGFSVFSKVVASILGVIATILGILVSLKTLSKK